MALKVHSFGRIQAHDRGPTPYAPDAETAQKIDVAWTGALQNRDRPISNRKIFSVLQVNGQAVLGHFVEYKWFVAQRRNATIFHTLRVQPLAVTGVLRCDAGVVIGQRSRHVTQDSGLWELVPSGGLDDESPTWKGQMDIEAHILKELSEEIGLTSAAISKTTFLCLVEDTEQHVFDIALELMAHISADQIQEAFSQLHNDEYIKIAVVPDDQIDAYLRKEDAHLTPLSRLLIQVIKDK